MNHASHSRVGVQQTVDHRGYSGQSFGRVPTGRHRSANLGKNSTITIDDAGGDLRASNIDTDHQSIAVRRFGRARLPGEHVRG
jgi:hypothetical protein